MCTSEPIARSSIQSVDSQTRAIAHTAAMMPSEPKPVRIALRNFPPASAPRSTSSSREVRKLPVCEKRSVTAASMKKM
eukprot:4315787-Pleurochrysis_carterae.AAC.1